jgi:hypothetical protein
MFKLCIYWHWLHQVIMFIKMLLMFSWFMKAFFPWSGISEVRTADSYGAYEFMSVRIFSCLCVSVFSFLGIRNFLSAIKYLSFCQYCPFSQGYRDILTRVCFEAIVTFLFIAAQFWKYTRQIRNTLFPWNIFHSRFAIFRRHFWKLELKLRKCDY